MRFWWGPCSKSFGGHVLQVLQRSFFGLPVLWHRCARPQGSSAVGRRVAPLLVSLGQESGYSVPGPTSVRLAGHPEGLLIEEAGEVGREWRWRIRVGRGLEPQERSLNSNHLLIHSTFVISF